MTLDTARTDLEGAVLSRHQTPKDTQPGRHGQETPRTGKQRQEVDSGEGGGDRTSLGAMAVTVKTVLAGSLRGNVLYVYFTIIKSVNKTKPNKHPESTHPLPPPLLPGRGHILPPDSRLVCLSCPIHSPHSRCSPRLLGTPRLPTCSRNTPPEPPAPSLALQVPRASSSPPDPAGTAPLLPLQALLAPAWSLPPSPVPPSPASSTPALSTFPYHNSYLQGSGGARHILPWPLGLCQPCLSSGSVAPQAQHSSAPGLSAVSCAPAAGRATHPACDPHASF